MKVVPFIAEDAAAALAQIHAQLGPDAMVLSFRPLPASGLSRLWRRHCKVEVLACVAEPESEKSRPAPGSQTSGDVLQRPELWSQGVSPGSGDLAGRGPHVFIGPPGVGKTTLLCKWLVSAVLNSGRSVRVWRLDGATANTGEVINVYGEMFHVGVERFWRGMDETVDLSLVDFPGADIEDRQGLSALKEQLAALPAPRVHLVLNAAYDISILYEQYRAFAPLRPHDVSFTHLDEEKRREKIHIFAAGTNCSLALLSAGQKIPGDFALAGTPVGPDVKSRLFTGVFERNGLEETGWQSSC